MRYLCPNIICGDDGVKKDIARILFLVALTIGLYWPVLRWLGKAWINNEYYNHGFFLLATSLLLIWFSRQRIIQSLSQNHGIGLPILIFTCSLYAIGFIIHQPVILAFSLLLFITALCLQFMGTQRTRYLLFPVFLLAFAVPIPSFGEFGIILQDWSASGASSLADLLGMDVSSSGNSIIIGEETYQVAPACSGLNRIMPLFSLTAIVAYVLEGHIWKKAVLMALVIPVALFSNIVRIVLTMWVGSTWSPDTALGLFHDISGVLLFVLAVGLIVLAACLMRMVRLRKEVFS